MDNKSEKKKIKTWKREFAGFLVLALFYMAFIGMFDPSMLVVPTFGFAMLAFGMDSAAKQMGFGKEKQEEEPYVDK